MPHYLWKIWIFGSTILTPVPFHSAIIHMQVSLQSTTNHFCAVLEAQFTGLSKLLYSYLSWQVWFGDTVQISYVLESTELCLQNQAKINNSEQEISCCKMYNWLPCWLSTHGSCLPGLDKKSNIGEWKGFEVGFLFFLFSCGLILGLDWLCFDLVAPALFIFLKESKRLKRPS